MGMENGLASALRVGVPVEQAEVVSYAEVGHVEEVCGYAMIYFLFLLPALRSDEAAFPASCAGPSFC